MNNRDERRNLKQQLFLIRRFIEGENVELSDEILELKNKYESLPNFTSWSGFPEKWDIGDPHCVKSGMFGNEIDQQNFVKAFNKSYDVIINKL